MNLPKLVIIGRCSKS